MQLAASSESQKGMSKTLIVNPQQYAAKSNAVA